MTLSPKKWPIKAKDEPSLCYVEITLLNTNPIFLSLWSLWALTQNSNVVSGIRWQVFVLVCYTILPLITLRLQCCFHHGENSVILNLHVYIRGLTGMSSAFQFFREQYILVLINLKKTFWFWHTHIFVLLMNCFYPKTKISY